MATSWDGQEEKPEPPEEAGDWLLLWGLWAFAVVLGVAGVLVVCVRP